MHFVVVRELPNGRKLVFGFWSTRAKAKATVVKAKRDNRDLKLSVHKVIADRGDMVDHDYYYDPNLDADKLDLKVIQASAAEDRLSGATAVIHYHRHGVPCVNKKHEGSIDVSHQ